MQTTGNALPFTRSCFTSRVGVASGRALTVFIPLECEVFCHGSRISLSPFQYRRCTPSGWRCHHGIAARVIHRRPLVLFTTIITSPWVYNLVYASGRATPRHPPPLNLHILRHVPYTCFPKYHVLNQFAAKIKNLNAYLQHIASTITFVWIVRHLILHVTAEEFVDPLEQALIEALDARDSLNSLCEEIRAFTLETLSNSDGQRPKRTFGVIYESLELSLPKLAEEFEIEVEDVQELLENLAFAEDVFARSCQNHKLDDLQGCVKLLQRTCVQMDELLEQVPAKILDGAHLLRGVRPTV